MSIEGDYIEAKQNVLRAALSVAAHEYDKAEDPGWQAEMDDEMLDDFVVSMASAINLKKQAKQEPKPTLLVETHADEDGYTACPHGDMNWAACPHACSRDRG